MLRRHKPITATTKVLSIVFAATSAFATTAVADEIILEFYDETALITGDFLGLSNGRYHVETPLGVFHIVSTIVKCSGEKCPTTEAVFLSTQFTHQQRPIILE